MRVLLLGGSGWIGRRLCASLLERDVDVAVFALAAAGLDERVQLVLGDRHVPADVARLRASVDADVVVDLVAYRPDDTRAMVETWGGRLRRYVHLGTLSAYRGARTLPVTEDSAILWDETSDGYGAGKAACERVLERAGRDGFPYVVLRSAPLMGDGDPVSRENAILKRLATTGRVTLPVPDGARLTVLYVEDLVRALTDVALGAGRDGRAYHLAQPDTGTLARHVELIAQRAGLAADLELLAPARAEAAGLPLYAFPYAPASAEARLDVSRALEELDFEPTPYVAALERTVDGLLAGDFSSAPAWPGRGATQSLLAGAHEWLLEDRLRRLGPPWVDVRTSPSETGDALTADAVLESICRGDGRVRAVSEEHRPARAETGGGRLVVVPEAPLALLPSAPAARADEPATLEAVVFGDVFDPEGRRTRLMTQHHMARARGYRHGNAPVRVIWRGFSGWNPRLDVDAGDRLVLTLAETADRDAYAAWRTRLADEVQPPVPPLAAAARCFLALAREPDSTDVDPFAIARTLRAFEVGESAAALVWSRRGHRFSGEQIGDAEAAGGSHIARGVALARVGDGPVHLVWPDAGRVLRLPRALVACAELLDAGHADATHAAVRLAAVLEIDLARATRVWEQGHAALRGHGVLSDAARRDPGVARHRD